MASIALLSHRGGNIGHDFMATGAEVVIREAFGPDVRIAHFEQHHHFSVYPEGHWLRMLHKVPHGRLRLLRRWLGRPNTCARFWPQTSRLDFDLAVTCGGPNIVAGASRTPEMRLMLHHLNGAFHYRRVPLVDAGVGACFPLERVPHRIEDPSDRGFYKTAFGYCDAVNVRDRVARQLCRDLGVDTQTIPCMALASGRVLEAVAKDRMTTEDEGFVLVNFLRRGSNTDWQQGVDPKKWMATGRAVIADLRRRHVIRLLAHSPYEKRLANELAPDLPCYHPTTIEEYGRVISGAKVGLVGRIHAAIPLAGLGIPSLVVGTDTRLGTVEELGISTVYVKCAEADRLVDDLEALIARSKSERERLIALREDTIGRYVHLFKTISETSR